MIKNVNSNEIDSFFTEADLHKLIEDVIEIGASDVHINSEDYIKVEIHGRFIVLSNHPLDSSEVISIVNNLYKSETGSEIVLSGKPLDHEYEYRYKKKDSSSTKSYSFRVNTAASTVSGRISASCTIRLLNDEAPLWQDMGYGENLWAKWRPANGLVVVSGATGTGKSTLLASGLRRVLEERENEKIITLESPIEYVLARYQKESTIVVQRSVPKNSESFVSGVEDSLRQHPTIVVIGESRRKKEIEAALLVSLSGHLTYTTTHTNSVPESAHRLLNEFSAEEQKSRMGDLMYTSRLFINQRLLQSTDGKRVAIREILEVDTDARNILEKTEPNKIKGVMRKLVNDYGQPFIEHAQFYLNHGLITQEQYDRINIEQKNEIK